MGSLSAIEKQKQNFLSEYQVKEINSTMDHRSLTIGQKLSSEPEELGEKGFY